MLRRRDPRRAARRPAALRRGRARRGAARAEAAEARAAAGVAAGERTRLETELAAAEARVGSLLRSIRRRDAEIDRLLGGAPERTLADLAAMPGLGVARLEPRASGA